MKGSVGIFKLTKLMEITILNNSPIAEKGRHMLQTNVLRLSNWKAIQSIRTAKCHKKIITKKLHRFFHNILAEIECVKYSTDVMHDKQYFSLCLWSNTVQL